MPRQTPSARHALEPAATEMALTSLLAQADHPPSLPGRVSPRQQLFPEEMSSRAKLVREWTQDFKLPLGGCLARASHPEPLTLPRRLASIPRISRRTTSRRCTWKGKGATSHANHLPLQHHMLGCTAVENRGQHDVRTRRHPKPPVFQPRSRPCSANTRGPFLTSTSSPPGRPRSGQSMCFA
jgi:hypothetical protein